MEIQIEDGKVKNLEQLMECSPWTDAPSSDGYLGCCSWRKSIGTINNAEHLIMEFHRCSDQAASICVKDNFINYETKDLKYCRDPHSGKTFLKSTLGDLRIQPVLYEDYLKERKEVQKNYEHVFWLLDKIDDLQLARTHKHPSFRPNRQCIFQGCYDVWGDGFTQEDATSCIKNRLNEAKEEGCIINYEVELKRGDKVYKEEHWKLTDKGQEILNYWK